MKESSNECLYKREKNAYKAMQSEHSIIELQALIII